MFLNFISVVCSKYIFILRLFHYLQIDDDTKRMYVMGLIEEADITAESREKFNEPKSNGKRKHYQDFFQVSQF